jgi:predicted transcriptional regulator
MQYVVVTRDNWSDLVRRAGVRLETLAVRTGKSYSTVYRYSNGSRRPSDEWIAQVAAVLGEGTA